MRKAILLLTLIGLVSSLLAQTTYEVTSQDFSFTPRDLTIQTGDIVTWRNVSGVHNANGSKATFPDNPEGFTSGAPRSGNWTYSFTFTQPGVYRYQCDPHVAFGMLGTVTVLADVPPVVISEIMYNPPEGGTDTLEYVELINTGSEAVDLTGYTFTAGFDFTFPAVVLQPDSFVIVAVDSMAFMRNFGRAAYQWTSGGLNNGGETIRLTLPDSTTVVDEVAYSDRNGWPSEPDGNGASLVLCDLSADNNNPLNWAAATTATGLTINGTAVLANPGAASNCSPQGATAFFVSTSRTVDEAAGTITISVGIFNGGAADRFVTLSVDASSTAVIEQDYNLTGGVLTLRGDDTTMVQIVIIDDDISEEDESFTLVINNPSGGLAIDDSRNTITITIEDNDTEVPTLSIGAVTTVDANGVIDSLNVTGRFRGIVYGVNLRPGGLQFTLIDAAGDGIGVFSSGNDYDYTVTEGDEVIVEGRVEQFRGLAQIVPDTVIWLSRDNMLMAPMVVTQLSEATESQLVRINNLTIVDPGQWTNSGAGFNVTVRDDQGREFTMRIDADVDIFGTTPPTGAFNLVGIGGQFDATEPLLDGYQILPRYQGDIMLITSTQEPQWARNIRVFPNPVHTVISLTTPQELDHIRLLDASGRLIGQWSLGGQLIELPASELAVGQYWLELYLNGEKAVRSVLKQ